MDLSDKLIALRRREGWSQEELAARLGVSRQSVSKWEGAQSVPDISRIVQLSQLFGVSCDYLLKEDAPPEAAPEPSAPQPAVRQVTMEEAADYLSLTRKNAPLRALATFLCVICPIPLLLLIAAAEDGRWSLTENAAVGVGLCSLLVLVAVAVALFLVCSARTRAYDFLEKEPVETSRELRAMVRRQEQDFQGPYSRLMASGVVLCILSAAPLFAAVSLQASDLAYIVAVCLLLFLVGLGCIFFVYGGSRWGALKKLLEEEDYTRAEKRRRSFLGAVSACYWLLVTAIYLFVTFSPVFPVGPEDSWLVWAIGGVLYAALLALLKLPRNK